MKPSQTAHEHVSSRKATFMAKVAGVKEVESFSSHLEPAISQASNNS